MRKPKILTFDIETSLQLAFTFGTGWKCRIMHDDIIEEQYMLGFSYKWLDKEDVGNEFLHQGPKRKFKAHDDEAMIRKLHKLLDEADIVVTYNGNRFDIPFFNARCLKYGLTPPSPYRSVDLFTTVRSKFKLNSKKLDYVNKFIGYSGKDAMCKQDWVDCHYNDVDAYEKMATYCDRDVVALEEAYIRVLPWITNHPNISQMSGKHCCPKCGSGELSLGGWTIPYMNGKQYRRKICANCGCHCVDRNIEKQVRADKPLVQ